MFIPLISLFLPQAFAMHVILDPGHGGIDHGTTHGDFKESDTALDVAQRLAHILKKDRHFKVTLTRASDHQISLPHRVQLADKAGGDIFVSIHVNSSPDPHAKGAEFYFQNQLDADEQSMFLAHQENEAPGAMDGNENPYLKNVNGPVRAILQDLLDTDRINQSSLLAKFLRTHWTGSKKNNSIHQAPFVVVSETHIPATLVELGFVTNPEDYQALTNSDYLDQVAQSLYNGIKAYKESLDKSFSPALKSANAF